MLLCFVQAFLVSECQQWKLKSSMIGSCEKIKTTTENSFIKNIYLWIWRFWSLILWTKCHWIFSVLLLLWIDSKIVRKNKQRVGRDGGGEFIWIKIMLFTLTSPSLSCIKAGSILGLSSTSSCILAAIGHSEQVLEDETTLEPWRSIEELQHRSCKARKLLKIAVYKFLTLEESSTLIIGRDEKLLGVGELVARLSAQNVKTWKTLTKTVLLRSSITTKTNPIKKQ